MLGKTVALAFGRVTIGTATQIGQPNARVAELAHKSRFEPVAPLQGVFMPGQTSLHLSERARYRI